MGSFCGTGVDVVILGLHLLVVVGAGAEAEVVVTAGAAVTGSFFLYHPLLSSFVFIRTDQSVTRQMDIPLICAYKLKFCLQSTQIIS